MNSLEQRRIWARRQGNPAWLWSEIDPSEWRKALARIEHILHSILNGAEVPPLEGSPDAVGLAGYTSGMGPMLGWWIEQGVLAAPPSVREILAAHLDNNRRRMKHLLGQAVTLVQALSARDIEVLMLKGADTALEYFPEPGTRPMSDIDLLVRPADVLAAEAALRAEGFVIDKHGRFESSWRAAGTPVEPRTLLFVDAEDPWSVDLHHSLDLAVAPGSPAGLDAAEPMASSRRWPACGSARALGQPLLLLHLAVHAGGGLQSLTLLRLLELVLVIRRDVASGRLDWDEFLDLARRTGSLGFAYPALALCRQLAPEAVPATVLESCAKAAPPRVLRVVAGLTPATAQRVDRSSIAEHFMWTQGLGGWLRQLAADLVPAAGSVGHSLAIYRTRSWRLLRGQVSR